jgi:hypothetical protein
VSVEIRVVVEAARFHEVVSAVLGQQRGDFAVAADVVWPQGKVHVRWLPRARDDQAVADAPDIMAA